MNREAWQHRAGMKSVTLIKTQLCVCPPHLSRSNFRSAASSPEHCCFTACSFARSLSGPVLSHGPWQQHKQTAAHKNSVCVAAEYLWIYTLCNTLDVSRLLPTQLGRWKLDKNVGKIKTNLWNCTGREFKESFSLSVQSSPSLWHFIQIWTFTLR